MATDSHCSTLAESSGWNGAVIAGCALHHAAQDSMHCSMHGGAGCSSLEAGPMQTKMLFHGRTLQLLCCNGPRHLEV